MSSLIATINLESNDDCEEVKMYLWRNFYGLNKDDCLVSIAKDDGMKLVKLCDLIEGVKEEELVEYIDGFFEYLQGYKYDFISLITEKICLKITVSGLIEDRTDVHSNVRDATGYYADFIQDNFKLASEFINDIQEFDKIFAEYLKAQRLFINKSMLRA